MIKLTCSLSIVVIVVAHVSLANSHAMAAGVDRLKEIEAAWLRREESISSGEFKWTVNRTLSHKPSGGGAFAPGEAIQETEAPVLQRYSERLVFNKERLRYESNEPRFYSTESRFIDRPSQSTFNGQLGKELIEQQLSNKFNHQGTIISEDPEIRSNELLAPILRHFQPSRTWPTILDGATVVGDELVLNNRPCTLIRSKAVKGSGNIISLTELYVDTQQDFCIRRVLRKRGGSISKQVDIDYRKEAEGWAPFNWKEVEYTVGGEIDRSLDATVTLARLNAPIDDSVFDLVFPPETLVTDARDREKIDKYVVRAAGPDRPILPGELSRVKTARDIINSEPGFAPRDSRTISWVLPAMGVVGLVTLVAVLLLWKRRKNAL